MSLTCLRNGKASVHGLQNVSVTNEKGRPDRVWFFNKGNLEGNLQDDFNQKRVHDLIYVLKDHSDCDMDNKLCLEM